MSKVSAVNICLDCLKVFAIKCLVPSHLDETCVGGMLHLTTLILIKRARAHFACAANCRFMSMGCYHMHQSTGILTHDAKFNMSNQFK